MHFDTADAEYRALQEDLDLLNSWRRASGLCIRQSEEAQQVAQRIRCRVVRLQGLDPQSAEFYREYLTYFNSAVACERPQLHVAA